MTKWQNHIGLDFGSNSIKLVELAPLEDGRFKLLNLSLVDTPKFENQAQRDIARVDAVKKLIKDSKISTKQAAITLPEAQVYTRILEMPFLEEPELTQAISWQAEQYVPVPLSEVSLKHFVLSLPDQGVAGAKMKVLLLAPPNNLVSSYISLVSASGLETVAIETEVLATIRSLGAGIINFPQSLLIHMGEETTSFTIYRENLLSLTQSAGTGGLTISRSVASQLGLDLAQAEQYKRSYGLDESKLEGKIAAAIKPCLDFVLAEAKKVLGAYESKGQVDPIKRVVLSGGGSLIPGLVQYFVSSFGLEVQLGNPFHNVDLTDVSKTIIGQSAPVFTVAVGLAMKPT